MSDPALDTPGRRYGEFLDNAIADLKPKDATAVTDATETKPTFTGPAEPINPVITGDRLKADTLMADIGPIIPTTLLPPAPTVVPAPALASVVKPKPKAAVNSVAEAIRAVASVNAKLVTRAGRIVERAALAHIKVDDTFDKQEGALAATEDAMDMLDASLQAVGNEEGNA